MRSPAPVNSTDVKRTVNRVNVVSEVSLHRIAEAEIFSPRYGRRITSIAKSNPNGELVNRNALVYPIRLD